MNASLVSGLSNPYDIAVSGSNLFVVNSGNGTLGEYTTSGAVVNASLISPLENPYGLALSGSNLFVKNGNDIGEYTTSGAVVNASVVPYSEVCLAVSGSNLFIAEGNSTIGEYTTSGAVVNASLVSGLSYPAGIAVTSSPTPEPSTFALLTAAGGIGLIVAVWRRRRGRRLQAATAAAEDDAPALVPFPSVV